MCYGKKIRTTSPSAAYSPVPRVLCVTTDISDSRIVQALSLVFLSVHVLDAPETSCGDSGGLRTRGHVHGLRGRIRHTAEWAKEFSQKGHGKVRRDDQNEEREELQIGGSVVEEGEVYFAGDLLCIASLPLRWENGNAPRR
jgi:hypothetical protein